MSCWKIPPKDIASRISNTKFNPSWLTVHVVGLDPRFCWLHSLTSVLGFKSLLVYASNLCCTFPPFIAWECSHKFLQEFLRHLFQQQSLPPNCEYPNQIPGSYWVCSFFGAHDPPISGGNGPRPRRSDRSVLWSRNLVLGITGELGILGGFVAGYGIGSSKRATIMVSSMLVPRCSQYRHNPRDT